MHMQQWYSRLSTSLLTLVFVTRSPIRRFGLFARKRIWAGDFICEFTGRSNMRWVSEWVDEVSLIRIGGGLLVLVGEMDAALCGDGTR